MVIEKRHPYGLKEDRLKLYKLALIDYQTANRFIKEGSPELVPEDLKRGFCKYFLDKWDIMLYGFDIEKNLPELAEQNPNLGSHNYLWHRRGPTDKRVEALEKAISLTEKLIRYAQSSSEG